MPDGVFVKSRLEDEPLPDLVSEEAGQLGRGFLLKEVKRLTFTLSALELND
jgi:hypothetical protein